MQELSINVVKIAQDLIRMPTVNPPGNEKPAIDYVFDLLTRHGIHCDLYSKDPNRPNLVARIAGRGNNVPPLLLYGHVDVVPVDESSWSTDPFSGEIKNGYLWGRGALDMKGGLAMLIAAFLHYHQSPGEADLILTVLSDEETGGEYGAHFLCEQHANLFQRVKHAIGEFGAFSFYVRGCHFLPIQIQEKIHCSLNVNLSGTGGHASIPTKDNVNLIAAKVMLAIEKKQAKWSITPVARSMIKGIRARLQGMPKLVLSLLLFTPTIPIGLKLAGGARKIFEPVLRTSVTPTVIRSGLKRNVIPEVLTLEYDIRMLASDSEQALRERLRKAGLKPEQITLKFSSRSAREPDMSQFSRLSEILSRVAPDATPVPMLLPGVTDGRHFSTLGIQTYGFLPMIMPPDIAFNQLIHGRDERISLETLEKGSDAILQYIESYQG